MANWTSGAQSRTLFRLEGLPWQVALYESLLSIGGISLFIIGIEIVRQLWGNAEWNSIYWVVRIIVICSGMLEIIVMNRRVLRHTTIHADSTVLSISSGRWMNISTCARVDALLSIDVKQGPLLRTLGLARVVLGSIGRPPEIPPMPHADALRLQSILSGGSTLKADGLA